MTRSNTASPLAAAETIRSPLRLGRAAGERLEASRPQCRIQVSRAVVDVSVLSEQDIEIALATAKRREPALFVEASGDVPPNARYALLERFVQLYEARHGQPFVL